jgi:hypothetical protein
LLSSAHTVETYHNYTRDCYVYQEWNGELKKLNFSYSEMQSTQHGLNVVTPFCLCCSIKASYVPHYSLHNKKDKTAEDQAALRRPYLVRLRATLKKDVPIWDCKGLYRVYLRPEPDPMEVCALVSCY